ncbi:MAG: hypothetical protein KGL38_08640 [Gemmatimonadota bacterium]|nr:hypothetical protein [Gemmatimonadota bacterium]MDE3128061.1 hypothetical protein [Gemmatimonadota bacterium]MDE3172754.1 hypothetical protein [Gemmatimonadota bacterium]MDE3217485.1 hypothetical protein [Gemmatimonadota bacterium]
MPGQIVVPGPNGTQITLPVPMTRAEVRALLARRDELSTQLGSAQGRRNALARQLQNPQVADRAGLEQQIQFLDQRILGIEQDIAENGKALASIPANMRAATGIDGGYFASPSAAVITAATGLVTMAMLFPFALLFARRLWRRQNAHPGSALSREQWQEGMERVARLETAVDTIAVEIERIGEGQRFITRVLGPGEAPFAEVRVSDRSAEPARRGNG